MTVQEKRNSGRYLMGLGAGVISGVMFGVVVAPALSHVPWWWGAIVYFAALGIALLGVKWTKTSPGATGTKYE